jgi:phage terminase large subunit-like protein
MPSQFWFDDALARAAVDFFARNLRLVDNEWAGKTFHLNPHQAHHIGQIFGWRRRDGTRRYRRVRWWEPKGGGKTELFAGVGHLLTVGDGEPTAEVFSYARAEEQAQICWNKAKKMVNADIAPSGARGPLAQLYETSAKSLFCPHLLSSFKFLSGSPEGKHGKSVHGALGDEAWEWEDGLLHRHLIKNMRSRRQPLDCVFTAAGVVNTYAYELWEESMAVLADPDRDPEMYVVNCGGTKDDDWTSPDNWAKWNPNYPVSPKHDFLDSLCREAQRTPRLENEFKQFHCGIWTEQASRWFSTLRWPELTRDRNDPQLWKKLPAEMRGRFAFGGLDLASNEDVTALVWVFRPEKPSDGGRYTLVPRFWVPEATVERRDHPTRPYKTWVKQGALMVTPGEVTDYAIIQAQIEKDAEQFRLLRDNKEEFSLAVDRWNATQLVVDLRKQGLPVALFGQGYQSMTAPSMMLERLYAHHGLEHGNHPVLKWMFGNAACDKYGSGLKPDKQKAADKIDGVVCTVMGLGLICGGVTETNLDDFLSNPVIIRA